MYHEYVNTLAPTDIPKQNYSAGEWAEIVGVHVYSYRAAK